MSALIFILILSFLVIIHELGHFLCARWAGIKVEEFGLGYPPRAKTLFTDKRGTIYSLNWLPFGGFVRMMGEDPSADGTEQFQVGSFASKPVWKRIIVVLAGATINFAFGVLAFGIIYGTHGIPTDLGGARIDAVAVDSPAAKSSVPVGELIVAVKDDLGNAVTTNTSQALIQFVGQNRGKSITLVLDSGQEYQLVARTEAETPLGQGSLGVTLADFELRQYPWWQMPFRGMWVGLKSAVSFGGMILQALGTMISELVLLGKVPADVAGPVGIVYAAEKDGFLRDGIWAQLNFAAILSINLAIINVLPFPALDGGRGVFLFWELLTRRRVKPKIEGWLNTVGFGLLICLILLISFRDIVRVFADQGVKQWFSGLLK